VSAPFVYLHPVRIDEVDAAGVVFFARYFGWCHEAMAAMLEPIDGGYAGLLTKRGIGLPTVHAEADYFAPLRFGDTASIAVSIEKVGSSSCTLAFGVGRASDATRVASIRHVVAMADLREMKSRPLPDDVRRVFERFAG
jgi:4-hydroxybenzoyl-CoA thioesterase